AEGGNESFVFVLLGKNLLGSVIFGVRLYLAASIRRLAFPGTAFSPLKIGISGRAGVSPASEESRGRGASTAFFLLNILARSQ
ncbi:MAG TPA: hypothetical protein PLA90_11205, partial [Candidatus Sumerlaeota bacterium]|nr:hypothetical protein [Candidatus Sumerlaeota bacterium]